MLEQQKSSIYMLLSILYATSMFFAILISSKSSTVNLAEFFTHDQHDEISRFRHVRLLLL